MRRRSNTENLERTLPRRSTNVTRSRSFSHTQSRTANRDSQHAMRAVGANNLLVRSALCGRRGSPRVGRSFSEDVASFFRRLRPSQNSSAAGPSSSAPPEVRGVRLQFETDHLMRKRTDSNRFFCAVCGVAYVRKQDLRQHILRLHSIGSRTDGGVAPVSNFIVIAFHLSEIH